MFGLGVFLASGVVVQIAVLGSSLTHASRHLCPHVHVL